MAERLAKVRFELDSSDWHGCGSELLWASFVSLTTGSQGFRLMNSPFFTRGIGIFDIVRAEATEEENTFAYQEVIERSGHSTYMIVVGSESNEFLSRWNVLEQDGCRYESAKLRLSMGERILFSVDIPPTANIHKMFSILEKGENDGVWIFQEGFAYLPKQ